VSRRSLDLPAAAIRRPNDRSTALWARRGRVGPPRREQIANVGLWTRCDVAPALFPTRRRPSTTGLVRIHDRFVTWRQCMPGIGRSRFSSVRKAPIGGGPRCTVGTSALIRSFAAGTRLLATSRQSPQASSAVARRLATTRFERHNGWCRSRQAPVESHHSCFGKTSSRPYTHCRLRRSRRLHRTHRRSPRA
jgi:hypothetical protein